jgi:hypothetical protein
MTLKNDAEVAYFKEWNETAKGCGPKTALEVFSLKVGDMVKSRIRIFDLPFATDGDWGPVVAEKGEVGVVEHAEEGCWPTVRFQSGRSTCCTDVEVEPHLPS